MKTSILLLIIVTATCCITTSLSEKDFLFVEKFESDPFVEKWSKSSDLKYIGQPIAWASSDTSAPGFENDKGLVLTEAMKYYGVGSKFSTPVSLGDENELVFQYELKFDDTLECGGAYIKLLRDSKGIFFLNLFMNLVIINYMYF
jgi:hypothetical protein